MEESTFSHFSKTSEYGHHNYYDDIMVHHSIKRMVIVKNRMVFGIAHLDIGASGQGGADWMWSTSCGSITKIRYTTRNRCRYLERTRKFQRPDMRSSLVDLETRNDELTEDLHCAIHQIHKLKLQRVNGKEESQVITSNLNKALAERSPTHQANQSEYVHGGNIMVSLYFFMAPQRTHNYYEHDTFFILSTVEIMKLTVSKFFSMPTHFVSDE
ncbi:unnamed protein product, partial [Nesidiocoris tenuis]